MPLVPPRAILYPAAAAAALAFPAAAVAQFDCTGVSRVAESTLTKVTVVTGIPGRPLFVTAAPADPNRLFVVDQNGIIWLKRRGDPPGTTSVFMDITDRVSANAFENETGLLGLAFDPDFATTGEFYVNYTDSTGGFLGPKRTVVSRFALDPIDPDQGDPSSEQILMRFDQPENNHNGGWIDFGPDGYLYISTGDGGGSNDNHGTCGNGQATGNVLGKLLRIDVRGIAPSSVPPDCVTDIANYQIPDDNPFVGQAGCDEIWSYGLRNPWRVSFDALNGDLYIGDVGQNCWEEIDYTAASSSGGENYGWRQMEGTHCFDPNDPTNCDPSNAPCVGSPNCNDPSLVLPVVEYAHVLNAECSVTGGYVYRGCRLTGIQGRYFYGDFCTGFIRSFVIAGGVATDPIDWTAEIGVGDTDALTSFGQDARGELYIVNRTGLIEKITAPLPDFEVSGAGAQPFLPSKTSDWTWEDLAFNSDHPIASYRVYRGVPNGEFLCIHQTAATSWTGDPDLPPAGELFAYLVTAVNGAGEETDPGGDPTRQLSPAACPP